jgi:hypothetical protein
VFSKLVGRLLEAQVERFLSSAHQMITQLVGVLAQFVGVHGLFL